MHRVKLQTFELAQELRRKPLGIFDSNSLNLIECCYNHVSSLKNGMGGAMSVRGLVGRKAFTRGTFMVHDGRMKLTVIDMQRG